MGSLLERDDHYYVQYRAVRKIVAKRLGLATVDFRHNAPGRGLSVMYEWLTELGHEVRPIDAYTSIDHGHESHDADAMMCSKCDLEFFYCVEHGDVYGCRNQVNIDEDRAGNYPTRCDGVGHHQREEFFHV